MVSDSEEVEIKIEYNESLERDPLCENFDVTSTEHIHKFSSSLVENIGELEDDSTVQLNEDDRSFFKDEIQQHEATWYKAIDSSGRFLCRFCNLTYSTVQTLRHHIKTKHSEEATYLRTMISNNKRNKKLKCHICHVRFKMLTDLQEHVKQNHDLENIKTSCNYCDATFENVKEMSDHIYLKHERRNSKFFTCTTCGYRTIKKSHFNQHNNTHLKLKNYNCQYCNYNTNYLQNLTIHTRIHTNDKPYYCDFDDCGYRCAAKSALKSHQLQHQRQENMLYCDKCNYTTVYKQSLKKHIDSHRRNGILTKL